MSLYNPVFDLASLLRELRQQRGVSQRQLADEAGIHHSLVNRAERGRDAQLGTWDKMFRGMGYYLEWEPVEMAEEIGGLLEEEAERRRQRRLEGLIKALFRL